MAEPLQPPSGFPGIPVSIFNSPVDQLLADGALTGAARPGVLGNVGRFEVLRMVGVGGMGIVALARDPQRQEMVAVKFLRPDLASVSAAVSRFRAEAHHMQRLNHPGILPVLEVVENGSSPCFVMPYMVGGSLAQALRAAKPLSTEQVLCVSLSIAEALVHAHSKGIIHRDLKPANVLLTPEGKACLSDFGLSRTVFNDSYVDLDKGHCEGTAPYMSPAVASGEAEDTRCDIYGFGAMLYEMLAGNPPYQGESTQVILEKIRSGPPSPIKDLNAKAHPGLATIAEGAMARELRQRYARMADVLEDLRLVESGSSPVGPRGLRGFSALRHRIRRVPTTTWRLMASALILLLVCVSLWWYTGWRLQVTSTLSLPQIKSWVETRTAQWDGVKGLEFIVPQESNGDLLPVTRQGQILHTFKIPAEGEPPLRISMVADLDQNGLEEVLVGWADPNQAHLSAINQNSHGVSKGQTM